MATPYDDNVRKVLDGVVVPKDQLTQRALHAEIETWWAGLTLREKIAARMLMAVKEPEGAPASEEAPADD